MWSCMAGLKAPEVALQYSRTLPGKPVLGSGVTLTVSSGFTGYLGKSFLGSMAVFLLFQFVPHKHGSPK